MLRVLRKLILKEIVHHPTNAILSVLALIAAVALCVSLVMTQDAAYRETKRVMRDMGFNVRIIPKGTDMGDFYLRGFSQRTFPEETIQRLASQKQVSYNHLVATLQQQIHVDDMSVVLVGLSGELFPPGLKKPPMIRPMDPGTVHVGYQVARHFGWKRGDTIRIQGEPFIIARVMPESGTTDDIRVIGNLKDVQRVLGMEGQINEIKAIDCLCLTPDENPQEVLREELNRLLPEAEVHLLSDIAEARARQRRMVESYMRFLIPLFLLLIGVLLAVLMILNVHGRRVEIGILRSLGYGGGTISGLILGRALLLGLIGAAVGYVLGTWLAIAVGPLLFPVTGRSIRSMPGLLGWSLAIAPLFSALMSLIPIVIAVTQDPVESLRAE